MRRVGPIAVALTVLGCSLAPSLKTDVDVVSFPARVTKVERVSRESAAPLMAFIPFVRGGLELPTGTMTSHTHSATMYTLAIANHDPVEIDASGQFAVGQCVILYVRRVNADNTRFFPSSGQLEAYDGCP